jgi:Tol biopolymer transport system component
MPASRRLLSLALLAPMTAGVVLAGAGGASAQVGGANGLIVYDQFRAETAGAQVWTVNPTTRSESDISHTTYGDDQPAFSPSGSLVAFRRNGQIWTMTPTGSNRRNLTASASTLSKPQWSPNGKQIVYLDNGHVGVMNANGSGRHQINNDDDNDPSWSPDGTKIVFSSYRVGDVVQLFTMTPTGGAIKDLSNDTTQTDSQAEWSPDGKHIIFTSSRATTGTDETYLMNADGSAKTELTDTISGTSDPAYSPDGQSFAFSANYQGNAQVFTRAISGAFGTEVPVTTEPGNSGDENLSWQPVVRPTVGLSSASGRRNASVTVSASGYGFGETLTISFKAANGTTTARATVVASGTGTASKAVTVPSGAALGNGSFVVTGKATARTAKSIFKVTA